MEFKITTAPSVEPVTTAEAKRHARIDLSDTDNDTYIGLLIKTARQCCEYYQNRAFIEQIITAKLDRFSDTIKLPRPPLISVTTVKYYDSAGDQQTLAATYYDVDTTSEPGRITLAYNKSWPAIRDIHHSVEIIYKAGYGDAASDVPEHTKTAIKELVSHFYERPETAKPMSYNALPKIVQCLLAYDRIVPLG